MDQESTFLAGDIGGTKTLLGIYSWHGMPKKKYQKRYISSDWPSIEPMIKDFIAHAPNEIKKPNFGCLGVAGRVINNFSSLTNLNWELYSTKIASSTNLKKIELINDFTALIYALPFLQTNQHTDIQNGAQKIRLDGVVAVIGAGTGLGIARGFLTKNSILALPSEGGHTEFAPRSKEEWLFSEWLKNELNLVRLSIERVISGTGLGYIAKWMIIKSNLDHPLKTKAEIWPNHSEERIDFPSLASQAAKDGDILMNQAVQFWLSAYGSAAGDLALSELCYSGLWIAGGATIKNLEGIKSEVFLDSLREKGRFKDVMRNFPIRAITDPQAGLYGAACKAHLLAESNEKLI